MEKVKAKVVEGLEKSRQDCTRGLRLLSGCENNRSSRPDVTHYSRVSCPWYRDKWDW
jgi:hypothetical protein